MSTTEKAWRDGVQLAKNRVAFAIQEADDRESRPLELGAAVEGLSDVEAKAFFAGYRWGMWSVEREVRCGERDIQRMQAGLPALG
ncbi:MAG: hypothetical protein OXT71_01930 [Acidobacteriota bacterium]|nr:hypothetical protein [Acidobacteriota bacterium]